jgi:hypothetical protein
VDTSLVTELFRCGFHAGRSNAKIASAIEGGYDKMFSDRFSSTGGVF